jgi:hypothetical protein
MCTLNLISTGTANRTVASTNMNATSSRAHTVVSIQFDQIIKTGAGQNKKTSVMNLVDLAGRLLVECLIDYRKAFNRC